MNGRKFLVVVIAAMAAAYFGARLAAPDFPGLALAGGASVTDAGSGLIAVTTAAGGNESNRLVMVDTNRKLLLVYRLRPNYMRLIAARSYKYDLKLEDIENSPGNGYRYEDIRDLILNSKMADEDKKSMPRGKELVVTTDGAGADGNRIVLINTTEKRILIYSMNGNFVGLTAMRRYDYDEQLEYTEGYAPGDGFDYKTIKERVEQKLKENAGGVNP